MDARSGTHLDGTISGVDEVVCALLWAEEVEELASFSPGGFDVSRPSLLHHVFEFDEDLFDWVQVGAVGRQEDEVRASGCDGGARGLALVAAKVVQDDDVTW